ncbi:MAG: sugar ABC transporter permease, partial [Clostridia bacterium]|nr:sugar ABC transporter permease [Clostridia bacterium]
MTQSKAKKRTPAVFGWFSSLAEVFREGDMWTRLSALIMGLGQLKRGQVIKGLLLMAFEALFIWFQTGFGWQYLKDFGTLGTNAQARVWDEAAQIFRRVPGDNSMLILLFSVLTLATF